MVVVALLSVNLVESVDLVFVDLVVNCSNDTTYPASESKLIEQKKTGVNFVD